MSKQGWIGVDLDGTLASYDNWKGVGHVGAPLMPMVNRVKQWLEEGVEVRIMTARAWSDGSVGRNLEVAVNTEAIQAWCKEHIGVVLPVTCTKDYFMVELWDDRAVRVDRNTGEPCAGCKGH
ncbi:MAG: hypothetical protein B7Z80_14480 [Rhodospirillales bacterium 20-64-7]|nr:MAG: hypothetical protein B7Z80_14480 [Rhodospirillales bacterium 20-64-7]